jgi:two-component system cell cycle sensor histidine kinase/response regulator CckA
MMAVLTDASELRMLEDKFAQSQKMEAVGKLAGGVAHDFNNVLTAISGNCDLLLLRKDASHPDFNDLTQIKQNSNRAVTLVRQLLAFSRKQTLQPKMLSVQDVVSDTLYLLDRLIGENITLSLDHGRDLGSVRADHQQLEQAIMNLVVNARDAMPDGGAIVIATKNCRLMEEEKHTGVSIPAGDYVKINVSDNGTGIDPAVMDKVFDPFFTTKAVGEGTGLGLSTVYGIVKQSGGYIYVENQPSGGASFTILLPRAYPSSAEISQGEEAEETAKPDLTGQGAVLLVEDEAPVRSFASRALKLRGYRVIEAESAEDAMVILSEGIEDVDVLVSDVVMPGMDGPTFAGKARELRPDLRVIFISGYAEDSFRRNLKDLEFEFLPKPFSLNELTAKVKSAIENRPRI